VTDTSVATSYSGEQIARYPDLLAEGIFDSLLCPAKVEFATCGAFLGWS
jgi:hypothetical protein